MSCKHCGQDCWHDGDDVRCRVASGDHAHGLALFAWSDRDDVSCASPTHLAEMIVSIALDHSYDRLEMLPYQLRLSGDEDACVLAERMIGFAREYMDGRWPAWRRETIDLWESDNCEEQWDAFVLALAAQAGTPA